MTVLVDTPVWSFAYRRAKRQRGEQMVVDELIRLIRGERAVLIAPIRQEVLTGISDRAKFEDVRVTLRGFVELNLSIAEYEQAAAMHNQCRRRGVQGSATDFLICAVALQNDVAIFTTDRDFTLYAKHTGIQLHSIAGK